MEPRIGFIPEPSQNSVQDNILIEIRCFRNVDRWKEFWRDKKKTELNDEDDYSRFMATGLSTGLNPIFGLKIAKQVSDNLEGLLTAVGKNLLKEAFRRRRFKQPTKKAREIYEVLQKLKKSGSVCFPTDKTNSTRVIQIEDYKRWVSDHLLKAA